MPHLVGLVGLNAHIARHGELGQRQRQQLLLGIAEQPAERDVDLEPGSLGRDESHPDRRVVEGDLVAVGFRRAVVFDDTGTREIEAGPDPADQRSGVVAHGGDMALDTGRRAVGLQEAVLLRAVCSDGDISLPPLQDTLGVLGMERCFPARSEGLLRRQARKRAPALVDIFVLTRGRRHEDPDGSARRHQPEDVVRGGEPLEARQGQCSGGAGELADCHYHAVTGIGECGAACPAGAAGAGRSPASRSPSASTHRSS